VTLYLPHVRILSSSDHCNISYEVWSIKTRNLIHQSYFEIPEPEFETFINVAAIPSDTEKFSFQFPTALSADLTTLVIPGLVVRLSEDTGLLDLQRGTRKTIGRQNLNMSLSGAASEKAFLQLNPEEFKKQYATQISKSGEMLVTLRRSSGLVELSSEHGSALWLAMIYCDSNFGSRSVPDYRYSGSIAFKPFNSQYSLYLKNSEASEDDAASIVLLHPYLPLIGFKHRNCILRQNPKKGREILNPYNSGEGETALWDFSCHGYSPRSFQFLTTNKRQAPNLFNSFRSVIKD
jgi:hypothetical protein